MLSKWHQEAICHYLNAPLFYRLFLRTCAWIHWGRSYSLSIRVVCPCPVTWQPGWHDTAPDPATTESDDLIAARVLFVFTIHISKPTVFHQQNLEITSANSLFGLCLVNFSITITLSLLLFLLFCILSLIVSQKTTCHCHYLCTFVRTTMLHLSDSYSRLSY